jgi:uncharacterized membrane protein
VDWYDWLLFFHVAAAFALVAALVVYWFAVAAGFWTDRLTTIAALGRITAPANVLVIVGTAGTIIFGVWLTIYLDGYELWDGWILASLILWAIGTYTGMRSGQEYAAATGLVARDTTAGVETAGDEILAVIRSRRALLFQAVTSLAVLIILILMIYKPGA